MTFFLIFITILCFSSPAYADSTNKVQEQELTSEQKKELAKEVGIILPGMTKDEVRETFGLLEPEINYTATGQEVWHYNSPEEQNIYFKDDKVERVKYLQRGKKPAREIKQPEEM